MDEFIRHLMPKDELDMTVCIAAICDVGGAGFHPKIVFCADRLVSAGIQFESGQSKIKQCAQNCYVLTTSNDSQTSDLILENVIARLGIDTELKPILKIVELIAEECRKFKDSQLERDVFAKYQSVAKSLGADVKDVLHHAVQELQGYQFVLKCEFLLIGFDNPDQPHIYKINQDGAYSLCDSTGFAAVGSGGWLAFLEMTKYGYTIAAGMSVAIPKVYLAKRVAERAAGVGLMTDIYVLHYFDKLNGYIVSANPPGFLEEVDKTYEAIKKYEGELLTSMSKGLLEKYWPQSLKPKMGEQATPSPSASG